MPWTVEFKPYNEKERVGYCKATYSGLLGVEFVYDGSLNLDGPETIDDFVAVAQKMKANDDTVKAISYKADTDAIAVKLNK